MKKFNYLAFAALAVTAAACSSDDVVDAPADAKSPIAFAPFVDYSTQSRTTNDITNANISEFAVYGFHQASSGASEFTKDFNGDRVYVSNPGATTDNQAKWTYDSKRYWQVGKYWFCALAPYGGSYSVPFPTFNQNGGYNNFGDITFNNSAETGAKGTQDLIYAFNRTAGIECTAAADFPADGLVNVGTKSDGTNDERVQFSFCHLLSRVRVELTNMDGSVSVLKISNLKFTNARTSGKYTGNGGEPTADGTWAAGESGWGPGEVAYDAVYYIPGVTDGPATAVYSAWQTLESNWAAEASPYEVVRYLIPGQGSTDNTLTLTFTATFLAKGTSDSKLEYGDKSTADFTATINNISGGMAQGTAYVLKANIDPATVDPDLKNEIEFTVTPDTGVEGWIADTDVTITPSKTESTGTGN